MSASSRAGSDKILLLTSSLAIQLVERAGGGGHHLGAYLDVARGGVDATVAQQDLQDADIGAVLQQVSGEAVPAMSSTI